MLTIIAGLVIVLGLMVSLARHVRHRSAETLTRDLLGRLHTLSSHRPALGQTLQGLPPLLAGPNTAYSESDLQAAAARNNRALVQAWLSHKAAVDFESLPLSLYDRQALRDAWGTPVVFMPPKALNIGIAPQNRPFFLSAGPDRRFSTILDNLYSYERPMETAALNEP